MSHVSAALGVPPGLLEAAAPRDHSSTSIEAVDNQAPAVRGQQPRAVPSWMFYEGLTSSCETQWTSAVGVLGDSFYCIE